MDCLRRSSLAFCTPSTSNAFCAAMSFLLSLSCKAAAQEVSSTVHMVSKRTQDENGPAQSPIVAINTAIDSLLVG